MPEPANATVYDSEIQLKEYSATAQDLLQAKKCNKTGFRLAREIWQLYLGPGGVGPNGYFMYQLYDDRKYSPQEKRALSPTAWSTGSPIPAAISAGTC